ncbi:MAG: hypothetical protein NC909_00105 [Candidatus Omnitrophica bacterium]|nr:hypothetical protein [Candidatus Omnitrophota bacterium]
MRSNYIFVVDLGSSKLACCLVEMKDRKRIKNIFFDCLPVAVLNHTGIKDLSGLKVSLIDLKDRVAKKTGIKVHDVYLSFFSSDLIMRYNSAVIPLAERGNKLITACDLQRVNEQAIALANFWEEEIIHSIAVSYSVDDKDGFINPLGMYAHKLEVELFTISIKSAHLETFHRLFNKLGFELKRIFIPGIDILNYILRKENLNKGMYVLLDIGAEISEVVIYEDKKILHVGAIPLGGNEFTKRLSQQFNISFEMAEELKNNYGTILEESILKDKEIMIKDINLYRRISNLKLCQILKDEAEKFLISLKDYLKRTVEGKRIDRIFVCGKTALLDGLLEKIELDLEVNVRMLSYNDFPFFSNPPLSSLLSLPQFLDYLNCLQVVYEVVQNSKRRSFVSSVLSKDGLFKRGIDWIQRLYQEYF